VLVPLLAVGALAYADSRSASTLPSGTRIAGVDVGGLTTGAALDRLQRLVGEPAGRSVTVHVGDRSFRLSADRAGVRLDLQSAVTEAHDAAQHGSFLARGWRALTGARKARTIAVPVDVNPRAVRSFVGSIHAAVARRAVDASYDLHVTSVTVTPSQPGRRLAGREDLVRRIVAALKRPDGRRDFTAHTATVQPKVTTDGIWDAQPVAVTVSKHDKMVRVFDRGKLVKRYHVAVGMDKYPTPEGRFAVQTMQKDPPWNVPDAEWAGDLAGKTIPGGAPDNPLKARWIGFDGSVGFHGTAELGSLGTAASHGCVRMRPADVKDLFKRVSIGTPVLVAAA
jgi:lipoprotein-anchoring transpeptidase ErfK/SrfK